MKQHRTNAIVLKRLNYGEADRILTLLTPSLGIVSVIVKGARKLKSKLAAGAELLAINQLVLIEGKSELYTVSSATLEHSFRNILSDLERTNSAFMMLRRVLKIKFIDETSDIYEITREALEAFDDLAVPPATTSLWSYLQLMQVLGHMPDLSVDSSGAALSEDKTYSLDEANGVLVVGGQLNSNHIKLWRLVNRYKPAQLAQINGAPIAAEESVKIAESALDYQLSG